MILSFQIGSNLVGLVFSFHPNDKSFVSQFGTHIITDNPIELNLVKKSAYNYWTYNRIKFGVSIRV